MCLIAPILDASSICKLYKKGVHSRGKTIIILRKCQHIRKSTSNLPTAQLLSVVDTAAMYISIPLTALIGLTFVAAIPQNDAYSREICEADCNAAYVECEYETGDTAGIVNAAAQAVWWVPVILAVVLIRTDFVFQ